MPPPAQFPFTTVTETFCAGVNPIGEIVMVFTVPVTTYEYQISCPPAGKGGVAPASQAFEIPSLVAVELSSLMQVFPL